MKAYCRDGHVIATHDDEQNVPASAYGEGVTILTLANGAVGAGDPLPDLDEGMLKGYARDKRNQVIAGGCVVTVDGLAIASWADAQTQAALTAIAVAAAANPAFETTWKGRDGQFYEINAADVSVLSQGVLAFVQAAFATESAVVADIEAENITDLDEIEAAAWPSNT